MADIKLLEYNPGIGLKEVTEKDILESKLQDFLMVSNGYSKRKSADIIAWMKKNCKVRRVNNKYSGLSAVNWDKLQASKRKSKKVKWLASAFQVKKTTEEVVPNAIEFLKLVEDKENE